MADMGRCKRPGFTGEGTETLAYGKAVPAIRDQASARPPETRVYRPRIAVPCDRTAAITALSTVTLDDRHPPVTEPER